ncbi:MAG: hypothetical protein JWM11_6207 [Planctomycetaceae bacterium]|nr:hypothetical protein [Planctomycetaceae bacterium]
MPFDVHDFLSVPQRLRGSRWIARAIRAAIKLEFFTIPPYLTAMWSVKDDQHPVVDQIRWIVRDEMSHLGQMCNLARSLGFSVNFGTSIPAYPNKLPGNVNPFCLVALEPLSKCLVGRVFLEIEKPEFTPIAPLALARTVPTIGAFYGALQDALKRAKPTFKRRNQITYNEPSHGVVINPILRVDDALNEIERVKAEGEGTIASPVGEPVPAGPPGKGRVAHYYRFEEMLRGKRLVYKTGAWSYSGKAIPFPDSSGIFRMAKVPPSGYPGIADDFNQLYTQAVDLLQKVWQTTSAAEADKALQASIEIMSLQMADAARDLMDKPIASSGGLWNYGPSFQYGL